jgi:hypothetical protein
MALPPLNETAGPLKKGVALMALLYLMSAVLPASLFGRHGDPQLVPGWVGRAIFIADALVFGAIFYGLMKRKPIFWTLIPILLGAYLASFVIGSFWSIRHLANYSHVPWFPIYLMYVILVSGFIVFVLWWRKQKSYFR